MDKAYDVIVLGLGGMGSAAAFHLAARGARTLGIDRYAPPHTHGSSHGDTRLTRQAIGEGDAYTPLALRANELWRDLEHRTGETLYVPTGGLILGDPDATDALHGRTDFLTRTLDAAHRYGIPHEVLTAREVRRRFPLFRVGPQDIGYYEPGAGYLRPERCVAAHLSLAQTQGADIHLNEPVLDYAPTPGGVRVRTGRGEYTAGRLIVTAGPWAGELLGGALRSLLTVYRQVLYWFEVEARAAEFAPGRFPVFIRSAGPDSVYGFPAIDGEGGGIKVAGEHYQAATTPDTVDRHVTAAETDAFYERCLRPALNGVGPRCLRAVTCLYTVTPDAHFVLDVHPDMPAVLVASPCSGHGFKHSAALGEALAEWATVGAPHLDLTPFSRARFTGDGGSQI